MFITLTGLEQFMTKPKKRMEYLSPDYPRKKYRIVNNPKNTNKVNTEGIQ